MSTKKSPEVVEASRRQAALAAERYKGCCEICDTPEECRGGKVPCELSGDFHLVNSEVGQT